MQKPSMKKKKQNANTGLLKILLGVFGVLIIGALVVGVLLILRVTSKDVDSLLDNPQQIAKPGDESPVDNPLLPDVPPPSKTVTYNGKTYQKNEGVVNLLFLGIDSNAERRHQNEGYRSDMVMVCAVDTVQKSATLLSIPRDTYTTVYKVNGKGAIEKTVQDRINTAYAFAGNDYRAANAMACVQMFLQRECKLETPLDFTLDIPVYFYGSIDMDGISKLASAVGGVEVTLDASIPDVGRKGQTIVLKGDRAETYLRNRKDTGGDLNRAMRQRLFMLSLAKKIKSMGAVDIIVSLYNDLQRYADTNLSTDNMLDFAKILMKVNIDDIRQLGVDGTSKTIDSAGVLIHNEQETLEMLLDVYYDEVP